MITEEQIEFDHRVHPIKIPDNSEYNRIKLIKLNSLGWGRNELNSIKRDINLKYITDLHVIDYHEGADTYLETIDSLNEYSNIRNENNNENNKKSRNKVKNAWNIITFERIKHPRHGLTEVQCKPKLNEGVYNVSDL